jgi:hypothetical protein
MQSPTEILRGIWISAGGDVAPLARVRLTGEEPQIPSSFRVAIAGQTTIAAAGLAAAEIWRLRSGEAQDVSVVLPETEALNGYIYPLEKVPVIGG